MTVILSLSIFYFVTSFFVAIVIDIKTSKLTHQDLSQLKQGKTDVGVFGKSNTKAK